MHVMLSTVAVTISLTCYHVNIFELLLFLLTVKTNLKPFEISSSELPFHFNFPF